jgi:hypothetical protein
MARRRRRLASTLDSPPADDHRRASNADGSDHTTFPTAARPAVARPQRTIGRQTRDSTDVTLPPRHGHAQVHACAAVAPAKDDLRARSPRTRRRPQLPMKAGSSGARVGRLLLARSRQAADRQSNARIAARASAGSATPSPRGLPSTPAGPTPCFWRNSGVSHRRRRVLRSCLHGHPPLGGRSVRGRRAAPAPGRVRYSSAPRLTCPRSFRSSWLGGSDLALERC